MRESTVVRGGEAVGDLREDLDRVVQLERSLSETIGQGLPWDQLHDEKWLSIVLLEAVERRDVRMLECC